MRKIEDKKELVKLCSFIIMGDGGVYKQTGNKNYCFIMNMKESNRDYIEYCKDILENITNCKIVERPDYNKDGYIRQPQLRLTSSNHPFFTKLHDRIYTDKYKGLDPHAFKLFDWECLAILFMSDGCSCYKKGYIDISLNMKRLSYGDQLYLKKELKDKFDLEWNINKQNQFYYLRLRTKDIPKFYNGIRPYILPSFQYKILDVEPSIIEVMRLSVPISNYRSYTEMILHNQVKYLIINKLGGEIPMGPFDSCRLMHLNLTSFVDNKYTSDVILNETLLYNVAYMTMRLSDDLIDLEIEAIDKIIRKIKKNGDTNELTLWENIRKTTINGRRTGMGFTGLADVIAMFNYKYGDDDSLLLTDQIANIIMTAQLDCTIDLALLRGTFPKYDDKLEFHGTNDFYEFVKINYPRQFERMYTNYIGRRNISWSAIAPTGTVSLLTQTSSGIEPVFLPYYQRRRKCSSPNDRVDYIDNVGEKYTEFFVLHPEFKKWINLQIDTKGKIYNILDKESLEQAYKDSPWYNSTASEINWKDRIQIQSIIQKYTTHAISSTLNLNSTITENEVSDIYMDAWYKGLKGVTIYRDGSRSGILNSIKEEDTESGRQVKKRPKVLVADYYQVKSKGKQYIVLVGLLNNKPYEVFTFQPTFDVNIKPHKGTITKLKKGQYAYDSDYIQIDNLELSTDNIEEKACSLYTSMLLRHNADIKFIVKTAKKVNENITSFSSAMCRVLSKYIENEEVKGEVCPECGGKLIREAGCIKCLDCDYSKCL